MVLENLKFKKVLTLFFLAFIFAIPLNAQSTVDTTFNAAVSRDVIGTDNAPVSVQLAIQPDGKILVAGDFNNAAGVPKNKIARLNADGTLDTSFNCVCDNFDHIGSAVVQPDGKIIIAGWYTPDQSIIHRARVARLNPNGSLDTSMTSPFTGSGDSKVWALAPDGKIYVSETFLGSPGPVVWLYRLNTNGTFDNSFAALNFDEGGWRDKLYALQVLPDGKLMVSGKHTRTGGYGYIFRMNLDGSKDTSFESPALANGSEPWAYIYDFGFQSSGKIVILGNFIAVNGLTRSGMARLNTDGSVDVTYTAGASGFNLDITSGDKILIHAIMRLNADGSPDNTYTPAYTSFGAFLLDSLERIVIVTTISESSANSRKIARMNADGSADGGFNLAYLGFSGDVLELAVQPDGKVILNGVFNRVNGALSSTLVRVDANGNLDPSFNAGTAVVPSSLKVIKPQADGKILIGGSFSTYNGTAQTGIARLNPDGTLDATFTPSLNFEASVNAIEFQTDGKILIGGVFSSINGVTRTSIARLNADGTLDINFSAVIGAPFAIHAIFVQPDGQIMIGGSFSGINGFNRTNFARLNADGTLDTSFNAGNIGTVSQIHHLASGKYLIKENGVLRRNPDGTADDSFTTVDPFNTGGIGQFVVQPDGSIIVVGWFTDIRGTTRNNIARVRSDGVLDTAFLAVGSDKRIHAIAEQTSGKYIVGGEFSRFENISRNGAARIATVPFQPRRSFDFDGDGKADVAVFRPSENTWYVLRSTDYGVTQQVWGIPGDVPVPADYDGDGRTDFAIFRASSSDWWSISSASGTAVNAQWGQSGDIPRPSDFDGDGRSDYIVFRPSNNLWYRASSANGAASNQQFGIAGDKPVIADFDGDAKSDLAIYRPSTGDWWWRSSADGVLRASHWGISSDIPVAADYDGDGKTDFAVYRPSEGGWYVNMSGGGAPITMAFGLSTDKPAPADYDGDGKADITIFRPSEGAWYILRSTQGFVGLYWGISTDIPVENIFVP